MSREKKLTLLECEDILENLGNELSEQTDILAIGGYCMLLLGARDTTMDIDFVPRTREFLLPFRYRSVVNSDVLNIADLRLEFEVLKPFAKEYRSFGLLNIWLAEPELLAAMKLFARRSRDQERDREDLLALSKVIDEEKTFKAYQAISPYYEDYEDWLLELRTEVALAAAYNGLEGSYVFAESEG